MTSCAVISSETTYTQSVVVLSFPRYCRYRSIARRLDGATDHWMQSALVAALGGILGVTGCTRVLFCKETFDYPELEGHELLCNHLTPKLAGRPRKKRKKRSSSPSSESNESEGSSFSAGSSSGKITRSGARQAAAATASMSLRFAPSIPSATASASINMPRTARMGARGSLTSRPGTASQAAGSREEQEFLRGLYAFMEKHKSPIDRVPSLGFKQIDLFAFYKKVNEFGGYQQVTTRKLWKRVYDEMGGSQSNTSAATCTRKHYERLLLTYERRLTLERKQSSKRREQVQQSAPEVVVKQDTPAPTTDNKPHTVTKPIEDSDTPVIVEEVISNPAQRRKSTSSLDERPAVKKRKLEILQQGGLEVTPIGQPPSTTPQSAVAIHRRSLEMMGSTAPNVGSNQVSITVTPDVSHMLNTSTEDTFKPPPPHRVTHHMFSRTGRIYDNPKMDLNRDRLKPDLEVLDLTVKSSTTSSLSVKTVKTPSTSSLIVKVKETSSLMLPPPAKVPELSILPRHNGHPLSNHNHQKNNHHHKHHYNKLSNHSKVKVPLGSSLEITLVDNSSSSSTSCSSDHQKQSQHNGKHSKHHHSHSQPSSLQHSKLTNNPFHIPLFPDPTMYYAALYNSQLYQTAQGLASSIPPGSVSPHELYKSLLMSHHHASSLPLLTSLNQSYPGLPRDGSTSITPVPRSK